MFKIKRNRVSKLPLFIVVTLVFSFSSHLSAEEVPSTKPDARDALSREVESLKEKVEYLEGFIEGLAYRIHLSGYTDIEYVYFQTGESALEPLIDPHPTFNLRNVNLYMGATISDYFRAFAEVRFLARQHGTFMEENLQDESTGQNIMERAWLDITLRDEFNIKIGKFLTPYGIWNMEHGSPILISTRTPLLLRKQIFPEKITGIGLHGIFFPLGWEAEYYAWLGNGKGRTDDTQDLNTNKAIGGRLAISAPIENLWGEFRLFKVGVSGYYGEVSGAYINFTFPTAMDPYNTPQNLEDDILLEKNDREALEFLDDLYGGRGLVFVQEAEWWNLADRYGYYYSPKLWALFDQRGYTPQGEPLKDYYDNVLGLDLQITIFRFLFQGEYAFNYVDAKQEGVRSFHERAFYTQLAYRHEFKKLGVIIPFARYGESDPNNRLEGEIGEQTLQVYGVNYKPITRVVFKVEYQFHLFDNPGWDFEMFASSVTVAL